MMFSKILYKGEKRHYIGKFLGIYYFNRAVPPIAWIIVGIVGVILFIVFEPKSLFDSYWLLFFLPLCYWIWIFRTAVTESVSIQKRNRFISLSHKVIALDSLEWIYEESCFCAKNEDGYYIIWINCSEEDAQAAIRIIKKIPYYAID